MNPCSSSRFIGPALALAATFVGASAFAQVTIPYSNDFSSTTLTNNGLFTLSGGTLNHTGAVGTTSSTPVAFSSVQLSNGANSSYTLSTSFRITSLDSSSNAAAFTGDQTVAIAAFALNSSFTGTTDATRYILADWTILSSTAGNNGRLRLLEVDGTNVVLGTTGLADTNGASTGVVTLNTFFTLRLNVTNTAPNTYDLTLGLFDEIGNQVGTSASITGYVATAAPLGGYYSGVRARFPVPSQAGSPTTVQFDNFSVIPEPSAFAALAGLGALGFVASRRRRA